MPSVMQSNFATVPVANVPRSRFNRSSGLKTCFDCDYLVPIYLDEVLPSDTFNMNATGLIRLNSPTLHPLMDQLKATMHWWFVPYRLVWDNWEKMHGAQDNPGDSIAYTIPTCSKATNAFTDEGSLLDYFGVPLNLIPDTTAISCLPIRGYNKIFNDWYRDENLQDSIVIDTGNGPDTLTSLDAVLRKRGKRFDYFTSALPSLQKGTATTIALGTSAPVATDVSSVGTAPVTVYSTDATDWQYLGAAASEVRLSSTSGNEAYQLYADLSNAVGPTLNDLRLSIATQRLLERDARSGTRYNEHLLAHFGTHNDDLRLQRPEFLGGGTIPINISSVPNTSEDATQKQGELTGYGVGSGRASFTKTFKEWGMLIGLISVQGDLTYSQGLDRFWSKQTRYDFAYPILASIGEQAVLDQEIYHDPAGTNNEDVWGYQPRYEEYRFKNSRLTNLMNVDATGTLSSWHLSEDFTTRPSLDSTFIESSTTTPLDRAIALPSEPQFNADFYFDLKCARPLPVNGVPGLTRL